MKATINNPLLVKAAGDLANGNYPYSVFQVRREGENLLVVGTNGYVSCCATVKADFERWSDGKCVTFGKEGVCAMMRALGKGIRRASEITFELLKGVVTVSAMVDGAEIAGKFSIESDSMRDKLSTFDWRNPHKNTGECSDILISPHMLKLASLAAKSLGIGDVSKLKLQGKDKPVRIDVKNEEVEACIVLMPLAESSLAACGW